MKLKTPCYYAPRHKWVDESKPDQVRQRCDHCGCYREKFPGQARWSYVLPDGQRIDPVDGGYILRQL